MLLASLKVYSSRQLLLRQTFKTKTFSSQFLLNIHSSSKYYVEYTQLNSLGNQFFIYLPLYKFKRMYKEQKLITKMHFGHTLMKDNTESSAGVVSATFKKKSKEKSALLRLLSPMVLPYIYYENENVGVSFNEYNSFH